MPQITVPTFAEGDAHQRWDVNISSKLPVLYGSILDLSKIAMPTARMCWDMKEYFDVDTEGNFQLHYEWGGANVEYTDGGNLVYSVDPVDNRSRMQVTPRIMFSTTGFNAFEQTRYRHSLYDMVGRRTISVNKGLTWVLNYETFAPQSPSGSTAPTGATAEASHVTNNSLDIDGMLLANIGSGQWAQNAIKLNNYPASVLSRVNSLPFLIRPHISGHEIQGINSSNIFWRSHVYIAQGPGGGTPTVPTDASPYIATNNSDLAVNVRDMIMRDQDGSPVNPSLDDIDYVLSNMQTGNKFTMLGVTSPSGLSYLRRNLFNYTQSSVSEPLMDFGINYLSYVQHSGGHCVFYQDPIMERLWPNSIIFFDPTLMPFGCVNEWGPKIKEWSYLPQTLGTYAMAKIMWLQRFVMDRQSTGWLLNCRWN